MSNENNTPKTMEAHFQELFGYLDTKFKGIDKQFADVNERLSIMEIGSNDDVIAMLKRIEKNTITLNSDAEFLAKKLGKHEMTLNRLDN
ncbi:hypothetical protein [Peribacillus muralis]|uniref:hypothetical protein n=1 Tax=Peribacillus muralis TaxID=264697 RepID=UPI00366EAA67